MAEVELKISSGNIEKTTSAVEAMIAQLEKLQAAEEGASGSGEKLSGQQKKTQSALDASAISAQKSVAMLGLEKSGLEATSEAYARKKAGILAHDEAARKGIKTGSDEYQVLLKNLTAREKAIASTKKLTAAKKLAEKGQKSLGDSSTQLGTTTTFLTGNLDRMTKQVQLIDGPLGGIASRMTALSSIMKSGIGPIALASVGLGLFLHQLSGGVSTAAAAEVGMRTLEAQVTATGNAAGLTAGQLDTMARSLAFSTLDNSTGVKEIISTMLTFKSVSTDVFKSAIELSEDMGIALKMNPVSAAKLLGKVLENPINNYKQLKRSGIEFTKSEKEAMEQYQLSGEVYEAQAIIIEKLEARFKGVAKAQADTLSGDVDTFGQKWEEFWESLGEKAIPRLREIVQLGSQFVDIMDAVASGGMNSAFTQWKNDVASGLDSIEDVEEAISALGDGMVLNIRKGETFQEGFRVMYRDLVKSVSLTKSLIPDDSILTKNEKTAILFKKQLGYLQDMLQNKLSHVKVEATLTEEQETGLETLERQLQQQERLTDAFIKTGDTRSDLYRGVKAEIDAEETLFKLKINGKSEEGKIIIASIRSLSDLTESRVLHNAAIQKQKSLLSKQDGLEKELLLLDLINGGMRKNSEEYILTSAAIDAKNAAKKAGFDVGSAEYEMILAETDALTKLQVALQKRADMAAAGVKIGANGTEVSTTGVDADFNDMLADKERLRSLDLDNEDLYKQKLQEIDDRYNLLTKNKMEQFGITMTEEGKEVLLSSDAAIFAERDEQLKALEIARRDGFIVDEATYLERRNELTREYDQKAIDNRQAQWEESIEHKRNMNQMELADNIQTGIDNLASVKKNNRALAVVSKAAAIYKAGVSFVDGLSEANKLEYPLNIMAYAKAFVQGTALVQQASSLTAPSYAFGGVDINGAGTGRSDSIQANIARGESVITAPATARHKETLKRMNQGLPISGSGGGGGKPNVSMSITIAGDASEKTVGLIEERLRAFESRVAQISQQVSTSSIQEENEIGGIMNPI